MTSTSMPVKACVLPPGEALGAEHAPERLLPLSLGQSITVVPLPIAFDLFQVLTRPNA